MKERVTAQWGNLADGKLAEAKRKLEEMAGAVRQKYNGSKQQALSELEQRESRGDATGASAPRAKGR